MNRQVLIFTDMDGSLLDHYTYSHAEADPLLSYLEQQGIPVIPCTSKTRRELLNIRNELGNPHPFIAENGAAVYIPEGYFTVKASDCFFEDGFWVKTFCEPRQHWLNLINAHREGFEQDFVGFADSTIDEIAQMTGLTQQQAIEASCREFGEPVQWLGEDSDKKAFIQSLESAGATVLQGGRFLHVTGSTDKGRALNWLTDQYATQNPTKSCYSIAIGDSENDRAMLEVADQALVIRSPVHQPPALHRTIGLDISADYGPKGWATGLSHILERLACC